MFCILKEWNDNIENQSNTTHRFTLTNTSPLNFFKSTSKPALYTFYSKFHELLVAKVELNNCLLENISFFVLLFSLHSISTMFYVSIVAPRVKFR